MYVYLMLPPVYTIGISARPYLYINQLPRFPPPLSPVHCFNFIPVCPCRLSDCLPVYLFPICLSACLDAGPSASPISYLAICLSV